MTKDESQYRIKAARGEEIITLDLQTDDPDRPLALAEAISSKWLHDQLAGNCTGWTVFVHHSNDDPKNIIYSCEKMD